MEREPRAEKTSVVADVRERFDEAEAVLVTEYRGLNVTQMTELRAALRDAEAIYKIYKNTQNFLRFQKMHQKNNGLLLNIEKQ